MEAYKLLITLRKSIATGLTAADGLAGLPEISQERAEGLAEVIRLAIAEERDFIKEVENKTLLTLEVFYALFIALGWDITESGNAGDYHGAIVRVLGTEPDADEIEDGYNESDATEVSRLIQSIKGGRL